ncbi:MAG: phosphate ABC transporter permease PstA [Thermomicrobiales bacterium]|nr:phosphate ABC transporter permease PstA [Thermomicrobiales bacterium]
MSVAFPPAGDESARARSNQLQRRHRVGAIMRVVFLAATCFAIVALATLLWTIIERGGSRLSWDLITNGPSRKPEIAGLNVALYGTLWVISLTILIAFPIGVGAAIYLEEYAPKNRWTKILQVNIANLAGVPSVVYGLLGLGVFVELMQIGRVVLAGALTMALLSLPVIIIAGQESLRAVPLSLRQAAYGVGATRWQVVRHHVLPAALPGILTGTILSISRAIGETAPLLVVGAALFLTSKPDSVFDSYSALPIQIYQWTSRPQAEFRVVAAAGIIVLLIVLLAMNAVAIVLRQRFSSKTRW